MASRGAFRSTGSLPIHSPKTAPQLTLDRSDGSDLARLRCKSDRGIGCAKTLIIAPLDDLKKEFIVAVKKLDTAAAHRVVHPNLAARKKSQLAKLVHKKETAGTK